ncbi:MAG TPA: alpha/beta hydrolase [Caulobacteraceae bacterium]|jgi:pimeloyl-ACP methyl ester carboxylesterase
MQQIERKTVSVRGVDLAYADGGEGPAVVYLHGALTTLEEGLIGLYPTLSPRFRMLAFDRPGHGASSSDAATGSAWRQAALLHDALKQLGVERPVLVGHSFGGAVALAYALQFPRALAGVVAIAPIAFPEPRLEQVLFGFRAIPGAGDLLSLMSIPADEVILPLLWGGMFLPQPVPDAFKANFPFATAARRIQLRADGEEASLMVSGLMASAAAYWASSVPVTVMAGDQDKVINPALHGRLLAQMLPRGRFVSLPGLGHMAHHFVPGQVADAIAELHKAESLKQAA